jgi:hypothetical protein
VLFLRIFFFLVQQGKSFSQTQTKSVTRIIRYRGHLSKIRRRNKGLLVLSFQQRSATMENQTHVSTTETKRAFHAPCAAISSTVSSQRAINRSALPRTHQAPSQQLPPNWKLPNWMLQRTHPTPIPHQGAWSGEPNTFLRSGEES